MSAAGWWLKDRARRLPPYRRTRAFLRRSERWTPEALAEHQEREVRTRVRRAFRSSPYYRRILEERLGADVEATDLDSVPIRLLPRLSREMVRDHHEGLRSRRVPRMVTREKSTSGTSTGIPLTFHEDLGAVMREHAFLTDLWSRIGYRDGDRMARLRADVVGRAGGRPWARFGNRLLLSPYHVTERSIADLVEGLNRFRPDWLIAYPSVLYAFCRLVPRRRCRALGVRGILAGSEKLYRWQRELFEEAFGARVMHWYGMAEKVVLAGECERSRKLHIYPQYGHFETERAGDGYRRVVGTSFVHSATPFIRYRVGDVVRLAPERYCRECGRPYPLIEELVGREQEFVVTKSGELLPFAEAVASIGGATWTGIDRWQIVQDGPGTVWFRVQPADALTSAKVSQIEKEFSRRFGDGIDVAVEAADVPARGAGKHRYFVQTLDLEQYR